MKFGLRSLLDDPGFSAGVWGSLIRQCGHGFGSGLCRSFDARNGSRHDRAGVN